MLIAHSFNPGYPFNGRALNWFHPVEPIFGPCVLSAVFITERIIEMDDYDKKPINVNQSSESSSTTIAIIVAALVVVVGAFFYFGSSSTPTDNPQVTQNNTTLPAPVIEPADPVPATPPAAQPETPPVTPPGEAPATNP
jgi:hypothetical protein